MNFNMIEQVFKVKLISTKDSFLHFSFRVLQKLSNKSSSVVLLKRTNTDNSLYFTWNSQPYGGLDESTVGISTVYANSLGLTDNESVIISSQQQAPVVKKVFVSAVTQDDYDMIEVCQNELQVSVLNQVRVVSAGQRIIVWFSNTLYCSMHINSLEPSTKLGRLEQLTEVIITSVEDSTNKSRAECNNVSICQDHNKNLEISDNDGTKKVNAADCTKDQCRKLNEILNRPKHCGIFRVVPIRSTSGCCDNLHTSIIHPYNAFVNKPVLSLWTNKSLEGCAAVVCYATKVNNNLKISRVQEDSGIYIRVYGIPENCKAMPTTGNTNNSYRNEALFVSNMVRDLLCLKTGSKVKLKLFKPCLDVKLQKVQLMVGSNLLLDEVENWFRNDLSANKNVLVNNNALMPVPSSTGSVEHVTVFLTPTDIHCWPFSCVELKTCRLAVDYASENEFSSSNEIEIDDTKEDSSDTDDFDDKLPASKLHGVGILPFSAVSILSRSLSDVLKEGILSLNQCLRLTTSCVVPEQIPIKMNCNTLCIGSSAHLLSDWLCCWLTKRNVHISKIDCKSLKGKKSENVQKLLVNKIQHCIYYQPSVLLLVDVDVIAGMPSQPENKMEEIFYQGVSRMVRDVLQEYQLNHNIGVLATARSTNTINPELIGSRGYHLFPTMLQIPTFSKADRVFIVKEIIKRRLKVETLDSNQMDFEEFAAKIEGYSYEDLLILVEKTFFQAWLRKVNEDSKELMIFNEDLSFAVDSYRPAHLHSINLYKCTDHSWASVGGMKTLKEKLTEYIIWPSKYRQVYGQCPLRSESGVLLYGVPGTGKTLLASALAGEAGLNFISIKGPELLSKYIGASEEAVRNVFDKAKKAKPCILFFDEFDSLAPRRGHDSSGVMDRVVNQLLTQMDGVEECTGVYIVATTSRPDLLDPALLRPGRIGYTLQCPLPDVDDRLEILQVLSKQLVLDSGCDLRYIAEQTEGFSSADLQAIIYGAQMIAYDELNQNVNNNEICSNDIQENKDVNNKFVVKNSHLIDTLADSKPSLPVEELKRYIGIYDNFERSRSKVKIDRPPTEIAQKITMA